MDLKPTWLSIALKVLPYAVIALCGAATTYYVMDNVRDREIADLKETQKAALVTVRDDQIAECERSKAVTERIDYETTADKMATTALYVAELERLLTKARAATATCKAESGSASFSYGKTDTGSVGTCNSPESILRLGYDGDRNGDIAIGCQKILCEVRPETPGC